MVVSEEAHAKNAGATDVSKASSKERKISFTSTKAAQIKTHTALNITGIRTSKPIIIGSDSQPKIEKWKIISKRKRKNTYKYNQKENRNKQVDDQDNTFCKEEKASENSGSLF